MNKNQCNFFVLKPALLLTILICLIYSNTLQSGWFLDDYHNITLNPQVQTRSLNADLLVKSFNPPSSNDIRPLAYFTFSMNWLWGQDNVIGYHVVNISIHILTAFFLFLTILLLLQAPNVKGLDRNSIYFIALLSAALWATHPIQTQAVTYIVQRMASMAALFYILGIFCYLKARMTDSTAYRILFMGLCGLSFLLGIGCKNNAIVLPISLLLADFVFFRDLNQKSTQRQAVALLFFGILIIALIGFFLFMDGDLINKAYAKRPFTMYQRLLTQPGIVLFYLTLIFYPVADRFSLTHDFTYSTSLLNPYTTLINIVIILLLIFFAVWRIKKNPVLSFAILFFLGNHVLESTILPLEMIFEHRNYLPSLFLFVPISIGIKKGLDYYRANQKFMFSFLVISLCCVMTGFGMSTYIRNWDWRSDKSLWEDAMRKAPESARPLHGLAWGYYEASGQIDKAIALYQQSLDLNSDQKLFNATIYNNLANIHYSDLKEYEKAVEYAKKAINISPSYYKAKLILCNALGVLGRYEESLKYLDRMLQETPDNQRCLYLRGFILMKLSKPNVAIESFRKCLKLSPDNWKYLREIGFCLTQMEHYEKGFWFLKRSESFRQNDSGCLLGLADNRIRAKKPDKASEYINQLIEKVGVENIEIILLKISEDKLGLPINISNIMPLISKNIQDRSEKVIKSLSQLTK